MRLVFVVLQSPVAYQVCTAMLEGRCVEQDGCHLQLSPQVHAADLLGHDASKRGTAD
jgi:hypothetical protein